MTPSEAYATLAQNYQVESLMPAPSIEYLCAVDLAIKALQKQIAKKPMFIPDIGAAEVIICPECGEDLMVGMELDAEDAPAYCWKCGQKLDREATR